MGKFGKTALVLLVVASGVAFGVFLARRSGDTAVTEQLQTDNSTADKEGHQASESAQQAVNQSTPKSGDVEATRKVEDPAPPVGHSRHAEPDSEYTIRQKPVVERPAEPTDGTTAKSLAERDWLGIATQGGDVQSPDGYPLARISQFQFTKVDPLPDKGTQIPITFGGGKPIQGTVTLSFAGESHKALGANLALPGGGTATMHLVFSPDGALQEGSILAPKNELSYAIASAQNGEVFVKGVERGYLEPEESTFYERPDGKEFFDGLTLPPQRDRRNAGGGISQTAQTGTPLIPLLESYPGGSAVVYLDFDGHTTSNTSWNTQFRNGADIVSAPFTTFGLRWEHRLGKSFAQGVELFWVRVANAFEPFTVNVTTDETVYNNAPPANRVRVVISPTGSWYGQGRRRDNGRHR